MVEGLCWSGDSWTPCSPNAFYKPACQIFQSDYHHPWFALSCVAGNYQRSRVVTGATSTPSHSKTLASSPSNYNSKTQLPSTASGKRGRSASFEYSAGIVLMISANSNYSTTPPNPTTQSSSAATPPDATYSNSSLLLHHCS